MAMKKKKCANPLMLLEYFVNTPIRNRTMLSVRRSVSGVKLPMTQLSAQPREIVCSVWDMEDLLQLQDIASAKGQRAESAFCARKAVRA